MTTSTPLPPNEAARLARLRALAILDTAHEPIFDTLTCLASELCGVPIALVSLVDSDRQWFKANLGLEGTTETPREVAICAHAIMSGDVLEVPDTALDPRFATSALVTGEPRIRFYAGAPITLSDGLRMGTLCVIDRQPRRLDQRQKLLLQALAATAAQAMEMRERGLRALGALHDSREMLHVTLASIADAVITTDAEGLVTWMNPVAERATGWATDEARGQPIAEVLNIVHEHSRHTATNPVHQCLAERRPVTQVERTVLIARDRTELGIENSAAPIRDADGTVHGVVLVLHDVTEQRRLSHEMNYRARHDSLTGLVNRAEFDLRLQRTLARPSRENQDNALLYIDLDQFKVVNDACGHATGDQMLRQISHLLRDCVRARDTLARLGGDEFGVLLEHCSVDQAQRVAQQICDRMEEFRFVHDGRRFRIGASIGLVPVDQRWKSTSAIMQAADSACYAAKESGRNRVHTWLDTDETLRLRHGQMQWVSRLEQALDEDRFELHAQRVCATAPPADGKDPGLHCEVLLRLREADGTLVPPGAFLPAAERYQMATRIDRWVVSRVVEMLNRAADEQRPFKSIAINLSGQSLSDRSFHHFVDKVVRNARFNVRRLCFEVTETAAITNLPDAGIFIGAMRALGIRVALDDFGAGASSFGYLKTLPVDYLKIDGQFIRDINHDALDRAAVRCFHEVAQVVGVRTVAEFVENEAILDTVRAIGIDYAQGYLLHQPEPLCGLLYGHGGPACTSSPPPDGTPPAPTAS